MKKNLIWVLLLYCFTAYSQNKTKIDTIYYLLDTTKTPVNDQMWEIGTELPFKHYVINCPCLAYNQVIAFMHPIADKGKTITSNELKQIKLVTIPTLIVKAKRFVADNFQGYTFFIIVPNKEHYIMHRVGVAPPHKPYIIDDGVLISPDTSKKNQQ